MRLFYLQTIFAFITCISAIAQPMVESTTYALCPEQQKDWNTHNLWGWMMEDNPNDPTNWYYYSTVGGPSVLAPHKMPFFSDDPILRGLAFDPVPILGHTLAEDSLDYKPTSGWELVRRSIGDATTGTNQPYWIFYNKFSAKLRIFILSFNTSPSTYKLMRLYFGSAYNPNLLVGSSSPILPTDQIRSYSSDANVFSAHMQPIAPTGTQGAWYYADFPMIYDPCTCIFQSADLTIDIKNIVSEDVDVTLDPINHPLNTIGDQSAKSSMSFQDLAGHDAETITSAVKIYKDLQDHVGDLSSILGDMGVDLQNKYTNEFNRIEHAAEPYLNMIPEVGPIVSGIVSLSDLFMNSSGSESSATPMTIINSFKASGTITTTTNDGGTHFFVPGGPQSGTGFYVNYNSTLGNFALLTTPTVEGRLGYTRNDNCDVASNISDLALNRDGAVLYEDFLFKVDGPIQWTVNPAVGFDLSKSRIEARLEVDLSNPWAFGLPSYVASLGPTTDFGSFNIVNQDNTHVTVASKFLPVDCFQNSTARLRLSKRQLSLGLASIDWRDTAHVSYGNTTRFNGTDNPHMFVKIAAHLTHPSGKISNFIARYPVKYNFEGPRHCKQIISGNPPSLTYLNTVIAPYYSNAMNSLFAAPGNSFGIQELPISGVLSNVAVANLNTYYTAIETIDIQSNLYTTYTNNGAEMKVYAGQITMEPGYEAGPGVTLMALDLADGCTSTISGPVSQTDIETFCTGTQYKITGRNAARVGEFEREVSIRGNSTTTLITLSPNPAPLTSPLQVNLTGKDASAATFSLLNTLGEAVPFSVQGDGGSYQLRHQATAPGVYILSISTPQGIERRRVVLQ